MMYADELYCKARNRAASYETNAIVASASTGPFGTTYRLECALEPKSTGNGYCGHSQDPELLLECFALWLMLKATKKPEPADLPF